MVNATSDLRYSEQEASGGEKKKSFAASQAIEGGPFTDLKSATVMCELYSKQDTLALREKHIG